MLHEYKISDSESQGFRHSKVIAIYKFPVKTWYGKFEYDWVMQDTCKEKTKMCLKLGK